MRLLGVELTRMASRRLTLVTVLVVLAFVGLLQLVVNVALTPTDPAEARATYAQAVQQWENTHEQYEQQCVDSGRSQQECVVPKPTEADLGLVPPTFPELFDSIVQTSAYLGGIAAFLIAASFIGAEFTSGAISNWLSFVPRRLHVYGAKLGAVIVTGAVIGAATGGLLLASGAVVASGHGIAVTGLPGLLATLARCVAAVVILAVIGFVVALIGRHTVVALGAFMAYGVLAFLRSTIFGNFAWAQQISPWVPETNLQALIGNGTSYFVTVNGDEVIRKVSVEHGSIYLSVLVVVLAVAAGVIFRRRDVN